MKQSESSEGVTFYWVIPAYVSACLLQPVLYWAGGWNLTSVFLMTSPIWLWGAFKYLSIRSESVMNLAGEAVGEDWTRVDPK